jgi:hypothetical protein
MFLFADGDLATYRDDPTCVAGFTLDAGRLNGACRILPARITHVQADHVRGHVWWYVDVALDGGARTTSVEIEHNERGDVWAGAKRRADDGAWVQYYRGEIMQVETSSSQATTNAILKQRETVWFWVSIASAALVLLATRSLNVTPERRKKLEAAIAAYRELKTS